MSERTIKKERAIPHERINRPVKKNLKQGEKVLAIMQDGKGRTLSEIQVIFGSRYGKPISETGLTARLRDFRKDHWPGYWMYCTPLRDSQGKATDTWIYMVTVPPEPIPAKVPTQQALFPQEAA